MIKIITVYNTLNPGSMLQATSLYDKLQEKYDDVCFLNLHIRHPYIGGIKLFIKRLWDFRFTDAMKQLIMPFQYGRVLKKYNKTDKINKDDIFIIGSDEIWNVSRKDMSKYPILWGDGLNLNRCISYAPSINNTTVEDLKKYKFIDNSIENMHAISVRDKYSKQILETISNRNIEMVCDPTMLIDREHYNFKKSIEKNYILIYGPERCFSKEAIEKITQYANDNNKKLLAYYFYHNWCNKTIYGSPYNFLDLLSNADYVFTSTFHGTIFSIIYNKQFVTFDKRNKKVQELLDLFDINTNFDENDNINKILEKQIDYNLINEKIYKLREQSENYLFTNIDKILSSN